MSLGDWNIGLCCNECFTQKIRVKKNHATPKNRQQRLLPLHLRALRLDVKMDERRRRDVHMRLKE